MDLVTHHLWVLFTIDCQGFAAKKRGTFETLNRPNVTK